MQPQILLLSAAGLLLYCSTVTVAKTCPLALPTQPSGYLSHVVCNYDDAVGKLHGYDTKVKITVTVAKSMEGWEIVLQLRNTDIVRVKSVRGGQIIGGETRQNGYLIFRNRIPRLEKLDSFHVYFTVRHGQQDGDLFPATIHLREPLPNELNGMCDGSKVRIAGTTFTWLNPRNRNKNDFKYKLSLRFLDLRLGDVASCRLNFIVPVLFKAVHDVEFVGQIDERNFVIGLNSSATSDIEYEISLPANPQHGFNTTNSECYKCNKNTSSGAYITATLPPRPDDFGDSSGTDRMDNALFTTATNVHTFATSPTQTSFTENTDKHDDQTTLKITPSTLVTGRQSIGFHFYTDQSDNVNEPHSDPDEVKSDGQSSSSHAVWIGVAVGCSIGLIVLIVVVSVLLISRRSSNTSATSQFEVSRVQASQASNNFYTHETRNGHATFNGPRPYRELPCTPGSSAELTKEGWVAYEELAVVYPEYGNLSNGTKYQTPAENNGPSTVTYDSLMLPGQRLNLPQANQSQFVSEASVPTGHYSIPRPSQVSDTSIVESGDEEVLEDDTYMAMHNPNESKKEQDA